MSFALDGPLFHWIYGWLHRPLWIPVWSGLTHLADQRVIQVLAAAGFLESLRARRRRPTQRREAGVPVLPWLGIPAAALITGLLKSAVGRARPAEGFSWPGMNSGEMGRSFPSGHATVIFALAAVLSLRWPRARWIWFGLAVGVALSRVALGLHWPSDCLAGALIGWGCVIGLRWAEQRWDRVNETSG